MSQQPGAIVTPDGVRFTVPSASAERVWVSLFDGQDREFDRIELDRTDEGWFSREVSGLGEGARYGLRADGRYDPEAGLWFDPAKLLMDPYARAIDRPYAYDPRLGARRWHAEDTAPLMPKALVPGAARPPMPAPPAFEPGGLVYEVNVRALTKLHPEVPEAMRGTVAAVAHPAIVEHLQCLHVSAVELMPVAAWMDERHLPPLGLRNAWGYNPVSFMALDPRIAPGGWDELRETVRTLGAAGIGVILDVVFNHTAESDALGPTLSLRGLDNRTYYRHAGERPALLVNDTGCGHTLDSRQPAVRRLVIDTLRAFAREAGVAGFRFDLATVLGRGPGGFDRQAPLLAEIAGDPELGGRVLIAEPWDVGPGGYQLGRFGAPFLEWNDRFRDDVRRFWRGDGGMTGRLATRLAGSFDLFEGDATRTINFVAAHDGMTLADLTAYETKHNAANGEDGRDGHDENLSWNNGVEGESDDVAVAERRSADVKALLATLFASRGTIMLTAGDEFGRSQGGNNNAYAQDNATTWLDWAGRNREVEVFTQALAALRARSGVLRGVARLEHGDVEWLREDGAALTVADWESGERRALAMVLRPPGQGLGVAVLVNGAGEAATFRLPGRWRLALASAACRASEDGFELAARNVAFIEEGDT